MSAVPTGRFAITSTPKPSSTLDAALRQTPVNRPAQPPTSAVRGGASLGGRCWVQTTPGVSELCVILPKPRLIRQITAQRYSLLRYHQRRFGCVAGAEPAGGIGSAAARADHRNRELSV